MSRQFTQYAFSFCFLFGAVLLVAAILSYREVPSDIPYVTSEAQLNRHVSGRVFVDAEVVNTGIYTRVRDSIELPIGGTWDTYIYWYLYIIMFEDMHVAFISRNSDLSLTDNHFVRVLILSEQTIALRMLEEYLQEGDEISQYVAMLSFTNTAILTLAAAIFFIIAGAIMLYLDRVIRKKEMAAMPTQESVAAIAQADTVPVREKLRVLEELGIKSTHTRFSELVEARCREYIPNYDELLWHLGGILRQLDHTCPDWRAGDKLSNDVYSFDYFDNKPAEYDDVHIPDILNEFARIAKGGFNIKNASVNIDRESSRVVYSFEYGGMTHTLDLDYGNEWFYIDVAARLNEILKNKGSSNFFCTGNFYGEPTIVLFTTEWTIEKLNKLTHINFEIEMYDSEAQAEIERMHKYFQAQADRSVRYEFIHGRHLIASLNAFVLGIVMLAITAAVMFLVEDYLILHGIISDYISYSAFAVIIGITVGIPVILMFIFPPKNVNVKGVGILHHDYVEIHVGKKISKIFFYKDMPLIKRASFRGNMYWTIGTVTIFEAVGGWIAKSDANREQVEAFAAAVEQRISNNQTM